MSQINTNAILDASGGTTTSINGYTPTASNMAGRNKIIGGDFTTNPWQRGTSFAAIANAAYYADRWKVGHSTGAVVTASKAADAPTVAQAGTFTQHCLSLAVTTADTSIAAGDYFFTHQTIEGLNAASFGFGQAGTRYVTLSFWVKGTKTGIHCVALVNSANNRTYVAEYTINSTNTWEYKTITIPVDTTGTWLYTNGAGIDVRFSLASGSNFQTSADTWAAGNFLATSNQVNVLDSTSNIFKIALVQLEVGSVATPFEHRQYGQELALCQRYYEVGSIASAGGHIGAAAVSVYSMTCYKATKRATVTFTTTNCQSQASGGTVTNRTFSTSANDTQGFSPQLAGSDPVCYVTWQASAEL